MRALLLIFFVALSASLSAQTWITEPSPNSSNISRLWKDGQGALYARATVKYFRSTDNGNNWQEMQINSQNMAGPAFTAWGDTLYYLQSTSWSGLGELFRSVDQGATWTNISSTQFMTIYGGGITAIFYRNGVMLASEQDSMYRSTDLGQTWQTVNTGLTGYNKAAINFEWFDNRIFFNTSSNGTFVSSDMGLTWSPINTGASIYTYQLAASDSMLFLTSYSSVTGLQPGATAWQPRNTGLPMSQAMSVTVSEDTVFAATEDLYVSYDRGITWNIVNTPGVPNSDFIDALLIKDNELFAANITGFNRGDRSDLVFSSSIKGFHSPGYTVNGIESYMDTLYLATAGGLYKRQDSEVNNWIYTGSDVSKIVLDVHNHFDTLYATDNNVSRSINGGYEWMSMNNGISSFITVGGFASAPNVVYAWTNNGVFRSEDGAQNWIQANGNLSHSTQAFHVDGNDVFMADNYGSNPGLWYSNDKGVTYTNIKGNIPGNIESVIQVGNTQYAISTPDLYKTTGINTNWTSVTVPSPVYQIFEHNGTLFIRADTGPYYSNDGGNSWTLIDAGLSFFDYTLKFELVKNDTLYAYANENVLKFPVGNIITGVKEQVQPIAVKAFPNPSEGVINFVLPSSAGTMDIIIYNVQGAEVARIQNAEGEEKIDLSHLDAGLYMYSVIDNGNAANGRFVIAR